MYEKCMVFLMYGKVWCEIKNLKKYTGQDQDGYNWIFVIVNLRFINVTLKQKRRILRNLQKGNISMKQSIE